MGHFSSPLQWILGCMMLLSSLGVLLFTRPVHASLSFLLTLMILALFYLQLSASFIATMQVIVYAGAIMVTFIFVLILFQDAHSQIDRNPPLSSKTLLWVSACAILFAILMFGWNLYKTSPAVPHSLPEFGYVEGLGKALYLDFFFPFEAVIFLFLVAIVGTFYIGRKGE